MSSHTVEATMAFVYKRIFYDPSPSYVGVGHWPDPVVERYSVCVRNKDEPTLIRRVGGYARRHSGTWEATMWFDGDTYEHEAPTEEEIKAWMFSLYLLIKGEEP